MQVAALFGHTMPLPDIASIRRRLGALTQKQTRELARASSVPFGTLQKLRLGTTSNPRIETLRLLLPHLRNVRRG